MARKIITKSKYKLAAGEVVGGEVMTDPDHAMSLKELIMRFQRGDHLVKKQPLYMGENSVDVSMLSKIERAEMLLALKQFTKDKRDEIQSKKNNKEEHKASDTKSESSEDGETKVEGEV